MNGLAVLGGIDNGWQLGKDTEHQQFAYGSQDAAIDDAHWRKQEASYDKQEANCKSQVEDFHSNECLRVPRARRGRSREPMAQFQGRFARSKWFQMVSDAPEPRATGTRISANGTAPLARLELCKVHMERPLVAREHP